jgi:Iron-dependent Transcriptional regulator
VISVTGECSCPHGLTIHHFWTMNAEMKASSIIWLDFPFRLRTGLKCLCCLAHSPVAMQSPEIATRVAVSPAETAKVLQLLVWGGFATSRRGSKGGFQLLRPSEKITMREVIDFFLSHRPEEMDRDFPILRALQDAIAPGQHAFARLTLAEAANLRPLRAVNKRASMPCGQFKQKRNRSFAY